MQITVSQSHNISFTVEETVFSENYGEQVDTLEKAIVLLQQAISIKLKGEWFIRCDVETKIKKVKNEK